MALTNINIRVDDTIKKEAQDIFSSMGLDMTTAINIFLRQAIRQRCIPFTVSMEKPNENSGEIPEKKHARRQEAFQRFMQYRGILPAGFDYKKELAEYRNERYGHTD